MRICAIRGPLRIPVTAGPEPARLAPTAVARLPGSPGVYRFRDAGDRVLYVGRASALRRRVASYWSDLRDRDHLAPMVAQIARIEAVSCDSAMDPANLTIAGWSLGMLVQFVVHGGRLSGWSQRSCSHPAATGALAATPAAWRDFTQRNAELAASLTKE